MIFLVSNSPMQVGYLSNIYKGRKINVIGLNCKGIGLIQLKESTKLFNGNYIGNLNYINLLNFYLYIFLIFSNSKIILGDYNSTFFKLLSKLRSFLKKDTIFVVDGGNMVRFNKKGGKNLKFSKLFSFFVSFGVNDERILFKEFNLPDFPYEIYKIDKNFFNYKYWILGSPDINDNIVSKETYFSKLFNEKSFNEAVYIAHRREKPENLKLIEKKIPVFKLTSNIEIIYKVCKFKKRLPQKIMHFGSTAAITISAISSNKQDLKLITYEKYQIKNNLWSYYRENIDFLNLEINKRKELSQK